MATDHDALAGRIPGRGCGQARFAVARPDLRGTRALVFVIALFGAGGAAAEELVAADPWRVIHIARDFGSAEVGRDGMRDPQIQGTLDGLHYRVNFYGCYLGRECDTILFDGRFSRKEWAEDPPARDIFDEWNRKKLVGRAWLDEDGRAVLDWPVVLAGGVPETAVRAAFERWRTALTEYAEHLGFR